MDEINAEYFSWMKWSNYRSCDSVKECPPIHNIHAKNVRKIDVNKFIDNRLFIYDIVITTCTYVLSYINFSMA